MFAVVGTQHNGFNLIMLVNIRILSELKWIKLHLQTQQLEESKRLSTFEVMDNFVEGFREIFFFLEKLTEKLKNYI